MQRRKFMQLALAGASFLGVSGLFRTGNAFAASNTIEKLERSDAEWKTRLTPQAYDILRHEGTERPFSSALLSEHRAGIFACAGCELPLFKSSAKYDSGTGWPSFFNTIAGHVETATDYKIIMPRTEYHCARCGGHHGHVFDDGPNPTGLRYCSNGAALKFIPDA